jgi:hypothetical protein
MADLVLKTGLWFLVTGIVLFLVARGYVSALVSLRSRSGIAKLAGGITLWVALAGVVVLPLFGALSFGGVRDASLSNVWFLAWLGLAYVLCVGPSLYYILVHRVRELRAAGFYREDT